MAGAAGAMLLICAGPAAAQLTVSTAAQHGPLTEYPTASTPFTPTWALPANNLIAGLLPSYELGAFGLDNSNSALSSLTSVTSDAGLAVGSVEGNQGPDPVGNATTSPNYLTFGNGYPAVDYGDQLIYTLPASTYGYNLTNIEVYGGWQDNGRCSQDYTVLYSTVANPGSFIYLTNVSYQPTIPNANAASSQVIIGQAGGGVIASNVAAVEFDFSCPGSENGWVGYGAIFLQGPPATALNLPSVSITTSNQQAAQLTPTWTPDTNNDLIFGLIPSSTNGNFNADGNLGPLSVLTDGLLAGDIVQGGANTWESQCVSLGAGAGTELIYTLPANATGYNVTNIAVYDTWQDEGRDGQYYTVSYSTVSAPTTYIPIATVYFNPGGNMTPSANQVMINNPSGKPLATSVGNIKFDFASPNDASQFNNAWSGYDQIVVQGMPSATPPPPPSPYLTQDTLPIEAQTVVGDQIVYTASYSNFPPVTLQWQQLTTSPADTNNINTGVVNVSANGMTASTLTLNNVQLSSSGYYRLAGFNATNGSAAPSYSTGVPLTVSNAPTLGNVVTEYAGQSGAYPFYPAWTINTNADLIFQFPDDGSGNAGTSTAGPGNYELQTGLAVDPVILVDGVLSDTLSNLVSCGWVNVGAGESMTYTLGVGTHGYGYDVTNIAVYAGWPDDSHNNLDFQVLYSTPSAPTTFSGTIGTFNYNPSLSSGQPNAARVILVPLSGKLAQDVYALQFNFNLQATKNYWSGYSEITVGGQSSLGVIPALAQDVTPLTAEDVVGSSLVITGAFTGATSYQWQKNGTNIPGATTTSLTLNNLQLTDAGGYQLLGIDAAGTNTTRACTVTIDPAPAPVGNVITAFAYQSSDASGNPNTFGPTWDTSALSSSLIYQQDPPAIAYGAGNFSDPDVNFPNSAGGLPVLTDGNYGVFAFNGSHPAFATAGPSAGQFVVYSLGSNPNGYTVTNIQIAGGWNDNGRNSQYYTVLYSTVANPTLFLPIDSVSISPSFSDESVVRTTITAANGVLASNAAAIYVNFLVPAGVPNGYSGYSEISVFGVPTASDTIPIVITAQDQDPAAGTSPTWTIETNSLIEGQLPSSVGSGSFAGNFNGEGQAGGLPVLTDGAFGPADSDLTYATAGGAYGAGSSITYTAKSGAWNITNIVVYSGWGNYNRGGQFYNITYSTAGAPGTFVPLTSVAYDPLFLLEPNVPSGPSANRVEIAPANGGYLATNVYAVKFDFTPQTGGLDNGYSGYAEIVLQGSVTVVPTLPAALRVAAVDGSLVITGNQGTPNAGYSVLTATNLLTPLADWKVSATGSLDSNGALSNALPINPAQPASFFRLRIP